MLLKLSICLPVFIAVLLCRPAFAQETNPRTLAELCDCPEFDPKTGYRQLARITESKNEIEFRYGSYGMGYNSFTVISRNKGQYRAVYYVARHPSYEVTTLEERKIPYNKYEISDARLDTVLDKLISNNIDKWRDPGFRNTSIADLGVMDVQYKINDRTGSYRIQPPDVMIQEHPEVSLYKSQLKVIKIFTGLADSVYRVDVKKRGFKFVVDQGP